MAMYRNIIKTLYKKLQHIYNVISITIKELRMMIRSVLTENKKREQLKDLSRLPSSETAEHLEDSGLEQDDLTVPEEDEKPYVTQDPFVKNYGPFPTTPIVR